MTDRDFADLRICQIARLEALKASHQWRDLNSAGQYLVNAALASMRADLAAIKAS